MSALAWQTHALDSPEVSGRSSVRLVTDPEQVPGHPMFAFDGVLDHDTREAFVRAWGLLADYAPEDELRAVAVRRRTSWAFVQSRETPEHLYRRQAEPVVVAPEPAAVFAAPVAEPPAPMAPVATVEVAPALIELPGAMETVAALAVVEPAVAEIAVTVPVVAAPAVVEPVEAAPAQRPPISPFAEVPSLELAGFAHEGTEAFPFNVVGVSRVAVDQSFAELDESAL